MAKKKNTEMIKFLDEKIIQAEKGIIRHNGQAPNDFNKLFQYIKLRQYYEDPEEAKL